MKNICPNCEKITEIKSITKTEKFNVKGENIPVEVEFFQCLECELAFDDPKSKDDPFEKAYRIYRNKHGMLQPEEIKEFRKKFGLTQAELCQILGWGGATLSRYENGALQDEAHEKTLRLVMDPTNLYKLVLDTNILSNEKKEGLLKDLRQMGKQTYSLERCIEEGIANYGPDEFCGYKKLDLVKLYNMVLYFCKEGVMKTKLNKMLFYADFKCYKENSISITGLRYARIPYGPVPDKYHYYFAAFFDNNLLRIEEIEYSDGIVGEKLTSLKSPDLSLFTDSELAVIAKVKDFFKSFNATKISNFSHDELGYKETENGCLISYKHALQLKI